MKRSMLYIAILFSSTAIGQKTLEDTIKIKEVKVESSSPFILKQNIDSIALDNPSNKDLGEVLARNSHAFVKSYGMGSIATVSLRGAASDHTNLVWNGIQLNSSSNGVVDFSLYPNLFMEELSLSYGANSLLQGSGGIGGVVEINNTVCFKKQQTISLEQQLGSFNFQSTQLKYQIGNSKFQSVSKLFYRTAKNNFSYEDIGVEGFPEKEVDHGNLMQKSFMQSIYYRPTNSWRLEAHYWYYFSDRNLPNMMTLRDLEENQKDESHRLSLGATKYFNQWTLKGQIAYLHDDLRYTNNGLEGVSESRNHSLRSLLDAEYQFKKWKFKGRLNADYEESFHPSLRRDLDRKTISLFTEASYYFKENLFVNIGFREEIILEEENFFLPSVSLNFKAYENIDWWWKLSAAKNVKYPNLNDLFWQAGGNPNLKAEESQQLEIATNYQKSLKNWKTKIDLALFYAEIDNYIQWIPSNLGYWTAENVRLVQTQGIEGGIGVAKEFRAWSNSLKLNYTYTQSINRTKDNVQDESLGKQLVYIPEHQANASYRFNYKDYFLNYDWQFVGARYLTTDNSSFLPFYQLSNISVGKSMQVKSNRFQIQASVLNIFDMDYQAIEWRPMPGRNYMLSLKWQLL